MAWAPNRSTLLGVCSTMWCHSMSSPAGPWARLNALNKAVMLRLPFFDVGGGHAALGEPVLQRGGNELATVVGADDLRLPIGFKDRPELLDHRPRADRGVDPTDQGDPREFVDHVED